MKKALFISLISIAFLTSPTLHANIFNPNESNLLDPPVQVKAKRSPSSYIVLIETRNI